MTPSQWRARFRAGEIRQTAALCPGYAQANMAFIPAGYAADFEAFLRANPAACPMLARGRPGDPGLPELGDFDLRHDLPLYRVFRNGAPVERVADIGPLWQEDLVPFAIGCSLTFEADLVAAGLTLRCYGPDVSCSAFDTTLPNVARGPFGGNLVVSMRAIRKDQVALARQMTKAHPDAHGAPIHVGTPAEIGVDLEKPIDDLGLTDIQEHELPVFWACGVTMERAIAASAIPFALTHAPGHMLITDRQTGIHPMNAFDIFFNPDVMLRAFPILLRGLGMTLLLGFTAIIFGSVLGLAIALIRLYAPRALQLLAIGYTDIMRAMPVLVVLILIYYALPFAGITLSSFAAAAIALSLVLGAYTAEVIRAGIQAVAKGQFEAASSLGLGFWRTMQKVILPQAVRLVIPPHASNCVSIIKDTSLASVVAMTDLLKQATDAQALFANPTPLIGAALIYVAILWPLVRLTGWLEHRVQRAYQR